MSVAVRIRYLFPKSIHWQMKLTGCWEGDSVSTIGGDGNLMNFEPDFAATVPLGDIARSLSHVNIHKALVIHGSIGLETNRRTSADSQSRGGSLSLRVVTAKVVAGYIRDLKE